MGPILLSKCFPGWKRCFKHIKRHAYWVVVGSASIVVVSKHFQALNCWTFRQNPDRWGPFDWLELRNAAGLGVPKGMTSWWRILAEWDKSKMLEECKDFVYIIHLYIPWISMTRLVHFLRCAHQTFIYSLCFFTPWEIAPLCSFHHILKKKSTLDSTLRASIKQQLNMDVHELCQASDCKWASELSFIPPFRFASRFWGMKGTHIKTAVLC